MRFQPIMLAPVGPLAFVFTLACGSPDYGVVMTPDSEEDVEMSTEEDSGEPSNDFDEEEEDEIVEEEDDSTEEEDCESEYLWYKDDDGDHYGASSSESDIWSCDPDNPPQPNYVTNADDCDDTNPNVHPGAEEICDWIPDNNCDGEDDFREVDDDDDGYTNCYMYHTQIDNDGDGYCDGGVDNNGDGDCTDEDDVIIPEDQSIPYEYHDCDVTDPNVYPGNGC